MAGELEKRASEAFLDDNFELALELYTQALSLDGRNANLLANRAQVNIKLERFTDAVADTNKAIELDRSMTKAYLRKGIACIQLEEYETAKAALKIGASLDPSNAKLKNLIEECDKRIAEEMNDVLRAPASMNLPSSVLHALGSPATGTEPVKEKVVGQGSTRSTSALVSPKPKYRHEFYQKPNEVVLTIFAKGVPAKNVVIEFGEQMLSVAIDVPGEGTFFFQPRLFAKIVPKMSRYEVLSTKIEIRLHKADTINWTSLEYKRKAKVSTLPKLNSPTDLKTERPTYPSSKSKGVDWDKLEAEVKKEEKDEKLDGDAALNKFFREIYQNADEDTRRAMSKSFVESNGTVLSTNWKDVGGKRVEGSAPDGLEFRKWEY
ncbi:unnamed protein product [Victoria cruziana]